MNFWCTKKLLSVSLITEYLPKMLFIFIIGRIVYSFFKTKKRILVANQK
jgi:hypothetical protein